MYPHESGLTTNSSQVDAEAPDEGLFPLFKDAHGLQFYVQPGQALYIPPGESVIIIHLIIPCSSEASKQD